MDSNWNITLRIYRKTSGRPAHFQDYAMEAAPDDYVLDVIERVWAFRDRSLVFNHACHHSVCGACGMRINGVEKLSCITTIGDVSRDGGTLVVEPLRNFPVVGDLVVDYGTMQRRLDDVHAHQVLHLRQTPTESGPGNSADVRDPELTRLVDCIECGLCVSACPVAATSESYLGPAVLAALHQESAAGRLEVLLHADSAEGIWRCHSAFECSAVCPSHVDPAGRIMDLRRRVVLRRLRNLFGGNRSGQSN